MRIGPDRAPRQPDFALAQMAPCLGYRPADAGAGATAAAFSALASRLLISNALRFSGPGGWVLSR